VTVTGHADSTPMDVPPELRGTPYERFFRGGPQQQRPPRRAFGQGSGFIIDSSGFIATNNHVVGEAASVRVELADGRELPARVVGTDPQTDLALLKVDPVGAPLPTVRFGDSDATRVGEWVLAVGNPFGLGGSATAGIVSARGRQIGAGPYDDFIQTDAPINPGSSGGPLFNTAGEGIGINTAIYSPSGANAGIGFAVPSRLAQHVIGQLKEGGRVERGWLGVSMQRLDQELAQAVGATDAKGALVATVERDSPAAQGGLRPGDVVVGFDGRPIESPRDLAVAVAAAKPGTAVTLALVRDNERTEQRVTIGQPPRSRTAALDRRDEEEKSSPASLGLSLAPARRDSGGAVVIRVRPDGPAAGRGVQEGDVILRAGDRAVSGPSDVSEAVRAAREAGRPSIAVQIEREGGRAFVALPLKQG